MSDRHDSEANLVGQVIVVLHADCRISRDEVVALFREAGIDTESVVFLSPEEASSCTDLNDAPVVIPIDAGVCDLPELENAALRCSDAGGRVVTVFGRGLSYDGMHPIADKYGTQCGWSPNDLSKCIADSETAAPLDESGSEVKRRQPKQVKCN